MRENKTVCEIIDTKFRDDAAPKEIDPKSGKQVAPTYPARQAVIRNGKSVLCTVTLKRIDTLEDMGVNPVLIAHFREKFDQADAQTKALNPTRDWSVPVKASKTATDTVALASLLTLNTANAAKAKKA